MTYQEQIDNIMDTFDFCNVTIAMRALDWTWGLDQHPPDEAEMRRAARGMLRTLVGEDVSFCCSGGFCALKDDGQLNLHWGIDSRTYTDGCWLEDGEQ